MNARRFSYTGLHIREMIVLSLFAGFTILVLSIVGAARGMPGDIGGACFGLISAIIFTSLLMLALLQKSDVIIDDSGISWFTFGKTWKTIRWNRINRIRIRSFKTRLFPSKTIIQYVIDQTEKPRLYFLKDGGLVFDNEIADFQELVSKINDYIGKYHIEILDLRKATEGQSGMVMRPGGASETSNQLRSRLSPHD